MRFRASVRVDIWLGEAEARFPSSASSRACLRVRALSPGTRREALYPRLWGGGIKRSLRLYGPAEKHSENAPSRRQNRADISPSPPLGSESAFSARRGKGCAVLAHAREPGSYFFGAAFADAFPCRLRRPACSRTQKSRAGFQHTGRFPESIFSALDFVQSAARDKREARQHPLVIA